MALMSTNCLAIEFTLEPTASSRWRRSEKTTSSAERVLPSWNSTPDFSLTVQTLASVVSTLSASSICTSLFSLRKVRRL